MSVLRHGRRARYTTLDNRTVEDPRLSFKELGVLVYLLSKPDGWEVNFRQLATTHSEGEFAVRSALARLEELGYLERGVEHNGAGQFVHTSIIHEVVNQVAVTATGETAAGETAAGETATQLKTEVVKPVEAKTDLATGQKPSSTDVDICDPKLNPDYAFDRFWDLYPMRKGKRLYKDATLKLWRAMTFDEKRLAYNGTRHYRVACDAEQQIAKDPNRWLRGRCWVDWQDPPAPVAVLGANGKERTMDMLKRLYDEGETA